MTKVENKNVKKTKIPKAQQKEVKKPKEAQKKKRKGKSLLTAYKINRMTKRLTLNLNRPCGAELYGKYV